MVTSRRKPEVKKIINCCQDPTSRQVHRAAVAYRNAGLSFIPISADGTKQPAFELLPSVAGRGNNIKRSWSVFRQRQPSRDEIDSWYGAPTGPGLRHGDPGRGS